MVGEIHQYIEQVKQEQVYSIPYDTRPMEGPLRPGERIVLHGGITIGNQTNEEIFIHEDFFLNKGGYHITVIHPASGAVLISSQQAPMQSAYLFVILDGVPVLERLERNLIAEASE